MMERASFGAALAVALLLFGTNGIAQERATSRTVDQTSVQRASRSGAFLPLTLAPNVGEFSAAGAGYGGYDLARGTARLQSFAEARLFGPLALRAAVESRDLDRSASPSALARAQLLSQADLGIDGAIALAYKAEGFNELEGEIELVIAVGRSIGDWRLLGNVAYGQDPEGSERDAEARGAVLQTLERRYTWGLDARGRFDLGSERAKLLAKNEPTFDLDVGPVLMIAIGPVQVGMQAGATAFERARGPVQAGFFALGGLGTAL